jgi:hypothetical protein
MARDEYRHRPAAAVPSHHRGNTFVLVVTTRESNNARPMKTRMKICYPSWIAAALAALAFFLNPGAHATEGGTSLYLPGTYNDFSAAVFGPSGVYYRNDFFAYHGTISAAPIGGRLLNDIDERVWMNSLKFNLLTDTHVLGARYGAALTLPIVLYGHAEGFVQLNPGEARRQNDRTGIGDLYFAPIQLNWQWNDHYLTFSQGIFAPTGSYDVDRVFNLGRNYWGFDPNLSYTWLNEKLGHEVSLTAGYLFNTRNDDTKYRSGNEFHFDFLVAHHFSPLFAVGLPGYWYKQMSGDNGSLFDGSNLGSFRGESAGVGLAILFRPTIASKDTSFILKWLHDIYAKRRLEGSQIMLSVAFKIS